MTDRIADYERRKAEGKPTGVPFGFWQLDEWTGGIQPHEFVAVAGFTGLGKSTMLMQLAFNAWKAHNRVLYISLEMERSAILRKFDAMLVGLDYRSLKNLNLPEDQMAKWRAQAEDIRMREIDITVIDSIPNCTPENVHAETAHHEPDIVFIDYIGLMQTSRGSKNVALWQKLTEITQDLKQNARMLRVPIVAAAQTNREGSKQGADLDNVGHSLSIAQDADIMVGLFQDDSMKQSNRMEVRLRKNRDGRLGDFKAVWDHDALAYHSIGDGQMFQRNPTDEPRQEAPDTPHWARASITDISSRRRPGT